MAMSTVKPKRVLVLGNKVYVRDLDSIQENLDEFSNVYMYTYDEVVMTKDEYFNLLQEEQENLKDAVGKLVLEGLGV